MLHQGVGQCVRHSGSGSGTIGMTVEANVSLLSPGTKPDTEVQANAWLPREPKR